MFFNGNQYTDTAASPASPLSLSSYESEPNVSSDSDYSDMPVDLGSDYSDMSFDLSEVFEETSSGPKHSPDNFIINIKLFQQFLTPFLRCDKCSSAMDFSESGPRVGLATTFSLICRICRSTTTFDNSEPLRDNSNKKEINMRFIYAMRTIGRGESAARMFNAIMDLPQPISNFQRYYPELLSATEEAAEESMQKAAEDVKSSEGKDIEASFDGSWQKRGFQSNNGIFTAISVKTGKILDVECRSRYCNICNHNDGSEHDCRKNHTSSSGAMESESAVIVYKRSEEKRGLRYVGYLGDGDSSAFNSVVASKPYGNTCKIYKLECINHIAKRVGARLRNLVETFKKNKQKLSDGKSIGGKGRLTGNQINRLQSLYRIAIIQNLGDVAAMKKAVMAIVYHSISTDENPAPAAAPALQSAPILPSYIASPPPVSPSLPVGSSSDVAITTTQLQLRRQRAMWQKEIDSDLEISDSNDSDYDSDDFDLEEDSSSGSEVEDD